VLALIGYDGDAVCDALAHAADRAGLSAVQVRDPAAWKVTVCLDGDGRGSVDLRAPDGVAVTCAVNRSLPPQADLAPGERNDLLAAWWAALALLPGRVVNRPDSTGFIPAPRMPASVLTSRPGAPAVGEVANVHDAHTGRFLYRADGAHPHTEAPVLRVTPFDPGRTWRLMLAGDRAVEVHAPADGLTARDRDAAQETISTLAAAGLGLALVVLSRDRGGVMRTVAVNPVPSLAHYQSRAEHVHSALIGWLAG
jgi:hypothetical protein